MSLSGRVTSHYGLPVWGASVYARTRFGNGAKTGVTGAYTITGLEAGDYEVTIGHKDYATKTVTARVDGRNRLDVTLDPCGKVSGTVRDAVSGAPIAGARVACDKRDAWSDEQVEAVSRPGSGAFECKGIQPGMRGVRAWAPGYPPQGHQVKVVSGARTEVELELKRAQTLDGTVADWAGAPVAGANVTLRWSGVAGEAVCQTDADGRFKLANVVRDGAWLEALHPEHPSAARQLTEEEAASGQAAIAFEQGATIEGYVLLDGMPVFGTQVYVIGAPPWTPESGAEGGYVVRGVPTGGTRVSVRIPLGNTGGDTSELQVIRWVEAAPGATVRENVDIVTTEAVVEGNITFEGKERGMASIGLNFETEQGHISYSCWAEDGDYLFSRLPAGKALLTANSYSSDFPAGCAFPIEVPAGAIVQQEVIFHARPEVCFEPARPLQDGEFCMVGIVPAARSEPIPEELDKAAYERYQWRHDYLSVRSVVFRSPEEEASRRTGQLLKGLAPGEYRLIMRRHVYNGTKGAVEGACYGSQYIRVGTDSPQTVKVEIPAP